MAEVPNERTKERPTRWVDPSRDDLRRYAFMKKSTSGIKTPKRYVDLIEQRLKLAEADYKRWRKEQHDESKSGDEESKRR